MLILIGLILVFFSVGYGFVMSHGQLATLWQPFEAVIIVGAALGAFIISNPWPIVKSVGSSIPKTVMGGFVDKAFFQDVLGLLFDLFNKSRREGMMAVESDVESPTSSPVFTRYPAVMKQKKIVEFIADYMRLMGSGNMVPHELETLLDQEIETRFHELERPAQAMSRVADALPGFGIVAAVLGIVITMQSIGGEPEELGMHVAAALVGTFAGVLLAYGVVGPLSVAMHHQADEEIRVYECIKACLVANLSGMPPPLAVEIGRKSLFTNKRPTFYELENQVRK